MKERFVHAVICWHCDELFEFESDVAFAELVAPLECPDCGAVWVGGCSIGRHGEMRRWAR